jgi:serine/threonine-protein kinase
MFRARVGDRPDQREELASTDSRLSRLVQRALGQLDDADRYERRSRALRLRKMLAVGALIYAAFAPVDLLYSRLAETAPLSFFWSTRAAGLAALLAGYLWLRRNRTPSLRALLIADLLVVGVVAITQGLFVVAAGGIDSPAATAIVVILVARSIAVADPWPRGLLLTAVPALLFGLTLTSAVVLEPSLRGAASEASVADLSLRAGLVLATAALVVTGSHFSWQLRRELFRARRFGRYRLKQRLSAGGMGEVWIAENQPLRQEVALKILPLASAKDPEMVARFEREVLATTRLRHQNTVRIYDFGMSQDGFWYYAMELLEGITLTKLVEDDGPVSPNRAIRLVTQAASAISAAHARGIVHRDVKPSNLFLCNPEDGNDFVKVLDFGVARIVGADLSGSTGDWGGGTPAYVSPEVARGQLADERSDVYGLGCSLYYLLTGRAPFEGDDPTELLLAHVHDVPAPPDTLLNRRLPAVITSLVMRCLEKDPAERYESATELLDALHAVDRRISEPHPGAVHAQASGSWLSTTDVDLTVLEP